MMRGIDSRHELDPTLLLRDTRTFTQRLADFFADPTNISIVLISLAAVSYYFSEAATFLLIMGAYFFFIAIPESKSCHFDCLKFRVRRITTI